MNVRLSVVWAKTVSAEAPSKLKTNGERARAGLDHRPGRGGVEGARGSVAATHPRGDVHRRPHEPDSVPLLLLPAGLAAWLGDRRHVLTDHRVSRPSRRRAPALDPVAEPVRER